jgi:hypothetical protein
MNIQFEQISSVLENLQDNQKINFNILENKYFELSEKYESMSLEQKQLKRQLSQIRIGNNDVEKDLPSNFPGEKTKISVNQKKQEATELFQKQEWGKAYSIFDEISDYYSSNQDFIFMEYDSLFKSNPMDSSKYPIIKENFESLKKTGYSNKEILEVLEYMENES